MTIDEKCQDTSKYGQNIGEKIIGKENCMQGHKTNTYFKVGCKIFFFVNLIFKGQNAKKSGKNYWRKIAKRNYWSKICSKISPKMV